MERRNRVVPALAAAAVIILFANTGYGSDEVFRLWSSVSATTELNEDWEFTFSEGLRFTDNASRFYYSSSSLSLNYSGFGDWLDVGVGFRKIFMKKSRHSWRQEDRPYVSFTLNGIYNRLDVSNRIRFEYRDKEDAKDVWRFRNRFQIEFPVRWTQLQLRPYMSDEIFVNFDEEHFNRNRVYAGVVYEFPEHTECKFYYLFQSWKSGDKWRDMNAVGITLNFSY